MNKNNKDNQFIFSSVNIARLAKEIHIPIAIVQNMNKKYGLLPCVDDKVVETIIKEQSLNLIAKLPPSPPELLGDRQFIKLHELKYAYIVGEMANGIATAEMVIAAAKSGLFGFFGSAGLIPEVIQKNLHLIKQALGSSAKNWGSNLIHSPQEPALEEAIVNLYLESNVRCVSASAYMSLSPQIVRYAATGLQSDPQGKIIRQNYILAKLSRPEVAKHFMSPPPQDMLDELTAQGKITRLEAQFAAKIPIAEDITVEGDSGGHTDNRPLAPLFSTIYMLGTDLAEKYHYDTPFRIGTAGGLGTPSAIAAAFSLGAAYVLTGSINAASIESGLCEESKRMLAEADIADIMMAPSADMFELGVKVQVLKRSSLFGQRAAKLYEVYRNYTSIDNIPPDEKHKIEQQIFRDTLENIWLLTCQFFTERNPKHITLAEKDPKYKMALIFRWYLGLSSQWSIIGDASRRLDYQIWCGPAMGAFNAWVVESFLEDITQRGVVQIAKNLLEGAAIITRMNQLRIYGIELPSNAFNFRPHVIEY
ncbi:MAG: PfaD family polyunsaturated fatty acid/polyketide biosynthesis protein [Gammaproteobacteria bacterium]|nr:PfaD family polyunsaturated fatty acid/polyketide biosynthesis protein [Gammaproteobacteria bacterium]